jgi:hypothetical protein
MEPDGRSLADVGYKGKNQNPATFPNPGDTSKGGQIACSLGALGGRSCHDYHNYVGDDVDAVRVNYSSRDLCGAFVIIAIGRRWWRQLERSLQVFTAGLSLAFIAAIVVGLLH